MIKRGFKSLIFVLMLNLCACAIVFCSNLSLSVFAVEEQTNNCCYLINGDTPYKSNVTTGVMNGSGSYVLGDKNIVLKATANPDYQLVGWQIVYNDQEDRTEYINTADLIDNKKKVILTNKDEKVVYAEITFVARGDYFNQSTFKLDTVFEDLTIIPVFDHIYYQMDISSLNKVSTFENSVVVGADTLYYSKKVDNSYLNSYLNVGRDYFYYGTVYEDDGNFYTVHHTLEDVACEEKIDISRGAFRVGDEVSINFDVDIDEFNFNVSKNIDLKNVVFSAQSSSELPKYNSESPTSTYYTLRQDTYLRTTGYEIQAVISSCSNYVNSLTLNYHYLYFIDINLAVDGNGNYDSVEDVIGNVTISSDQSQFIANVSVYDYYSIVSKDNLQFFAKRPIDNNYRSFSINATSIISKTTINGIYDYYNFENIDNIEKTNINYANIDQNLTITINYSSIKYEIKFDTAEQIKNESDSILIGLENEGINSLQLLRGASFITGNGEPISETGANVGDYYFDIDTSIIYFKQTDKWIKLRDAISFSGYKFIGFASSLSDEVNDSYTYTVDNIEPCGTIIYLCYIKEEFEVEIQNYNKISYSKDGNIIYPLRNLSLIKSDAGGNIRETPTLTGESVKLTNIKLKLGDVLSISDEVNHGFMVKYSLDSDGSEFLTSFSFDKELLDKYVIDKKIVIYVYESEVKFTLTYNIEVQYNNENGYFVMAQIDVDVTGLDVVVDKYDLSGDKISEDDTAISKIVVSNLSLNNVLKLKSVANAFNADTNYVFNWFVADKSQLPLAEDSDENTKITTITILKDIAVTVSYSIPTTNVKVSLSDDFNTIEEFKNDLLVEVANMPYVLDTNLTFNVGENVTIKISAIGFGYIFLGYQINMGEIVQPTTAEFSFTTIQGDNNIILVFDQIDYKFYFSQYNAVVDSNIQNGEYVQFGTENYVVLNIDNTHTLIQKPDGYFVEKATISNEECGINVENNLVCRSGDANNIYSFNLNRDEFKYIVETYVVNGEDGKYEVYIRLDYSIYLYDLKISYKNRFTKGFDEQIDKLPIVLTYELNGEATEIPGVYQGHTISFLETIPYGAKAEINVLEDFQTGLNPIGWAYNDKELTLVKYPSTTKKLMLETVTNNLDFLYLYDFVDYAVQLNYDTKKGTPILSINNNIISDVASATLHLFDKISIVAEASRERGYKFKSFSYKTSLDIEQVYSESDEFVIEKFIVEDYFIDVIEGRSAFVVSIEYEELKFTIKNEIVESFTSIPEEEKINFNLEDLANIVICANSNNTLREIDELGEVSIFDVILITLQINTSAKNIYNESAEYDLTNGLELKSVQVWGQPVSTGTGSKKGEYKITFYVKDLFNAEKHGSEIYIKYSLGVQMKNVTVTTVIPKEFSEFYKNITMFVGSKAYFGGTTSKSGQKFLSANRSFLAPINSYVVLSANYQSLFRISGVRIYLTAYNAKDNVYYIEGSAISASDYNLYGISLYRNERLDPNIFDVQVDINNLQYNVQIEYLIQPIIQYNNGPEFEKEFKWNANGEAVSQQLSVGITTKNDIQIATVFNDVIDSLFNIQYERVVDGVLTGEITDSVTNVGDYQVYLTLNNVTLTLNNVTKKYNWFKDVVIAEYITLKIIPKAITLTYNSETIQKVEKYYDKKSVYPVNGFELLKQHFLFSDGTNSLAYNFSEFDLRLSSSIKNYISISGKDGEVSRANENGYYNLYIYDILLENTKFNNNFYLTNNDLIIKDFIKIKKLVVDLTGITVKSKVFDDSYDAELVSYSGISISNMMAGDDVVLSANKLKIQFTDKAIGTNKTVTVDASGALGGTDADNYKVNDIQFSNLTIYPYKISTKVDGVGEVSLVNERGLTQDDCVGLIPIDATLKVEAIFIDSTKYANIFNMIAAYVKGTKEFAIGYTLTVTSKEKVDLSKLYLNVPNVQNIIGTYVITNSGVIEEKYEAKDGLVSIDLSSTDLAFNTVFLTQKRVFLKVWQIILIVLTAVAFISGIVILFVIIRMRKVKEYSVHDKI